MAEEQQKKRLGYDQFKVLSGEGAQLPSAHIPSIFDAIRTGDPYPVRMGLIFGNNALSTYGDVKLVYETLMALDYIMVAELYMTPTAELADLILPVSTWAEVDAPNLTSRFAYRRSGYKLIDNPPIDRALGISESSGFESRRPDRHELFYWWLDRNEQRTLMRPQADKQHRAFEDLRSRLEAYRDGMRARRRERIKDEQLQGKMSEALADHLAKLGYRLPDKKDR